VKGWSSGKSVKGEGSSAPHKIGGGREKDDTKNARRAGEKGNLEDRGGIKAQFI